MKSRTKHGNALLFAGMVASTFSAASAAGVLTAADKRRFRDIFSDPEPPAQKTARDLERLAAAQAKRARKAMKKGKA